MKSHLTRATAFLLLIVAVALGLRLWGIGFGLPFSYANDEYHEVMRALELGSGGFNLERTGKGGFYYLLFIEYGFYFVWLKLAGIVHSAADFSRHFVHDPSAFYYMGRATAAAFGAATVAMVFATTRRAYSAEAGFVAAIILCANVLHVDLSHQIGVDVPLACFTAGSLYFAVRLAANGAARDYRWAALFAAFATTTKLPGALLVVPLLTAHAYAVAGRGGGFKDWLRSRELWIAVVLFTLVLVATNPGIVLDRELLSPITGGSDDLAGDEGDFLERPNLFVFYFDVLRASMGWPLFVVSMAGTAYGLWKRTAADVILIPFAAIFFLLIASTSNQLLYYPRYVLPILVVLASLAGRFLFEMWQRFGPRNVVLASAVVAALVALPATQSIMHDQVLVQTDTRTLAKEWIERHVPAGSRVLIEGLKIKPVKTTVQLQDTPQNLRKRIAFWRKVEPKQAKFLQLELEVLEGTTFDLELINISAVDSLQSYERRGVEYFVIRPVPFLESRRSEAGSERLLEALRSDPRVRKIAEFPGNPAERPGPTIEVYQLAGARSSSSPATVRP